ncbi:MAG: phosphotransferase [Candidatus Cloacimonetes bacterium]|nr:phosphotransferase [Candidatus Cloacimonadota bacterium]
MTNFNSLTERGKIQRYRRVLTQALVEYPIKVQAIRFISNTSKPVFRVHTGAGSYAAKFHNPAEHTLAQMASELCFLDYVSSHSDMRIEIPLANSRGDFITELQSTWLPATAHVALCSWVPGVALKSYISASAYRHLGRCAAMLHKASASFRPGQTFSILTNNKVFYWDKETVLTKQDRKLLPRQRQDLFCQGARVAQRAITEVWKSGQPRVIHNDLHPCNLKVQRGKLSMYDFEDITWGFPQQDIGTAMFHVCSRSDYPDLLCAFQEGYRKVLSWPLESDRQLDHFVIARVLMFANYVLNFDLDPSKFLPQYESMLEILLNGKAS